MISSMAWSGGGHPASGRGKIGEMFGQLTKQIADVLSRQRPLHAKGTALHPRHADRRHALQRSAGHAPVHSLRGLAWMDSSASGPASKEPTADMQKWWTTPTVLHCSWCSPTGFSSGCFSRRTGAPDDATGRGRGGLVISRSASHSPWLRSIVGVALGSSSRRSLQWILLWGWRLPWEAAFHAGHSSGGWWFRPGPGASQ